MTPQTLAASAAQAKTQGNQMLASDQANANSYGNAYNSDTAQSAAANKNLQSYTSYMQNAGNPLNLYNTGVSQAQQAEGFNPASLGTATQNLTQSQNALAALNQASQSSTGGYGLSGAQLGGYYSSLAAPLSNQIGAQSTAVGNLKQLYQNALTQGQQGAQLGYQGEQTVSYNLNQVYQNAQNQAAQALSQVQFYKNLAQQQGGLNAQQQQYYAQSISALQNAQAALTQANAAAQQAAAQSALLGQQSAFQKLQNIAAQNQLNASKATTPAVSLQGSTPTLQGSTTTPAATKTNSVASLLQPTGFSSGAGNFNIQ